MAKSFAPTKIIWFGDHAAVYGHSALAMAIDRKVCVEFEQGIFQNKIDSNFLKGGKKLVRDLPLGEEEFYYNALGLLEQNNFCDLKKPWYRPIQCLTGKFDYDNEVFAGNKYSISINACVDKPITPKGCGVGSAIGAALSASMYYYFYKKINKNLILNDALFFENITHGNKYSGLDATTIVKGGYFLVQDGAVKRANGISKHWVLVVNSGASARTETQVSSLENLIDTSNSAKLKLEEIGKISAKGIELFRSNAKYNEVLPKIGKLMYENHEILSSLDVSCPELDTIVALSKKFDAYGAKMTGAGGGGAAIVIGKNLKKIRKALFNEGFQSFITSTNFSGVEID